MQNTLLASEREDPASTTDRSRVVDSRLRRRAIRNGLIVGMSLAACFMAIWVVFAFYMAFVHGDASFGGLGAGAEDPHFEWWESAIIWLLAAFLLAADIRIGIAAYRRTIKRRR